MPAHPIAQVQISDPSAYRLYPSTSIEQHGALILVGDGQTEVLEGESHVDRVVVIELPSWRRGAASIVAPEYREIKSLGTAVPDVQFLVAQGV